MFINTAQSNETDVGRWGRHSVSLLSQVAQVKRTEQRLLAEMLEGAEGVSSPALMEGGQSTRRESPTA